MTKKIRFEVPGVRPELLQPVGMEFSKDGGSSSWRWALPIASLSSTPRPSRW